MQKLLLSVVVVVLCAPMLLARRENNERDNRRLQKQALRKCEYQWGECVFAGGAACGTGKKTGTSDNAECPVKQVEKKCKVKCTAAQSSSNCKYRTARGSEKSECDPVSKKRPITQTLVSGGDACQKSITVYKPCRSRSPRDLQNDSPANTDNKCKYRKGQKGECNTQTNTRTITMTLKRKSPSSCAPTKTVEKPCKVKPARQDKSNGRKQQGGRQTGGSNRRNREQ